MNFRFLIFISFLLFWNSLEEIKAEDNFTITLLTYSSGQELYSSFGHSALRVMDSSNHTDLVYNYGTFDFNTPDFYKKFIKGKLPYRLSRVPTEYVIQSTQKENRSIVENELLLTSLEKKVLVGMLEENYLPENRSYLYDFFYDNCATRIVDIIDSATGGRFQMQIPNYKITSFIQHLDIYLDKHQWSKLGMDIAAGYSGQKLASDQESAFIPNQLQLLFKHSFDSETDQYLTAPDSLLLKQNNSVYPKRKHQIFTSFTIALLFLILCILCLIMEWHSRTVFIILDYMMVGIPVIAGLFLSMLWIVSDHDVYAWNHTILWANPLFALHFIKKIRGNLVFNGFVFLSLAVGGILSAVFDNSPAIILFPIMIGLRLLPIKDLFKKL